MARRKQRTKEEIEKEILDFVDNLRFPTTSTEIARAVGLNFTTAKKYLDKLKGEGKLHLKKVGRQNQWWIENVFEQKQLAKKAVELERENVEVKEEIKEVKQDNRELKDEIKEAKIDNRELKEEVREVKIDNRELKEEIRELKKQILELKS